MARTPSSVMDLDATAEEAQQWQDQQAQDERYLQDIEQEIAEAKGEGDYNIFDGTNKHVVPFDYTPAELERYDKRDQELRAYFPNYDAMVAVAGDAVRRNSELWRQLRNSKDPALEAFELGLRLTGEKTAQHKAQGYQPAPRTPTRQQIDMMSPQDMEAAVEEYRNGG